jgi:hypothetical protein
MNNKKLVSRISNSINAVNKDARVSKRYILEVATSKAIFLMSQKFRDRSLFRESNLFLPVDCFELEKIDKYKCPIVEFKTCNTVMKSKKKLPELVYSKYGSSLKEVTNIDFSLDFRPTTPAKFRRDKRREGYGIDRFWYLKDGYLYLPDSDVRMVSLTLYTPNTYEATKTSGCKENECLNPWEFEFSCSSKLLEVVIQETIKEISLRLQIIPDENPNLDENIKSKTTN